LIAGAAFVCYFFLQALLIRCHYKAINQRSKPQKATLNSNKFLNALILSLWQGFYKI